MGPSGVLRLTFFYGMMVGAFMCKAQGRPYSQVSIGMGIFRNGIIDKALGPYQLKGTSVPISLNYSRVKEKINHHIQFTRSAPELSSASQIGIHIESTGYLLAYTMAFRVFSSGKLTYWAGPGLTAQANLRYPEFTTQAEGLISLDSFGRIQYHASDKNNFEFGLSCPLVGILVNRGFLIGEEETNFVWPQTVRGIKLELNFFRRINKAWDYGLVTRMQYLHITLLNEVMNYNHQFLFSLRYRFQTAENEKS